MSFWKPNRVIVVILHGVVLASIYFEWWLTGLAALLVIWILA